MNNSQARKIINDRIKEVTFISQSRIQWPNQTDFKPPLGEIWCRITVQYLDSVVAGLCSGTLERDIGLLSIQVFAPKGYGDKSLIELADKWRKHWKGFGDSHFEVTKTNAPTDASGDVDDLYVMSLVRVEFRLN